MKMEKLVGEILGKEVVRLGEHNSSEQIFDFEIVEGSAIYNQEETVSIERLNSSELEEIYYVTVKVNDTWEIEGYYQAV